MYKFDKNDAGLRVFIVHPGGPFWKDKDEGVWGIPKGEIEDGENDMLEVAKRELKEETGIDLFSRKKEEFADLGSVKQKSGKEVFCYAIEEDWTGLLICSSYFEMEWPTKSGKTIKFPEVDKAGFFFLEMARKKMNEAQREFLDRLMLFLEGRSGYNNAADSRNKRY